MLKKQFRMLPFYLAVILLGACSDKQTEPSGRTRLARVGSEYLTLQEARREIPDFVLKQDSINVLQRYRKEWIQEQLLLKKADSLQLARQPQVRARLENARREVLTNALREVILAKFRAETNISDEEVLQYYDKVKEQFILEERYVRFRLVSTKSFDNAKAARIALQSGTSWPKVARSYSQDPEQKIKHSKKYWPVSTVLNELPNMKRYIASIDSGEISPIRQHKGVFHFVQLTGARASGQNAKPEWIMGRLKKWILMEKQRQFYNSYLKNLYLEAKSNNETEIYNVLKDNSNTKQDTVEIN